MPSVLLDSWTNVGGGFAILGTAIWRFSALSQRVVAVEATIMEMKASEVRNLERIYMQLDRIEEKLSKLQDAQS